MHFGGILMPQAATQNPDPSGDLSRRKRQILDILYTLGKADVQTVLDRMADAPSYSAVRATMNTMVEEGVLKFTKVSRKYVYAPARSRTAAAAHAARYVLATFFGGSVTRAMEGILDAADRQLPPEEIARLSRMIQEARTKEQS
jgi:BlaI family transcriptional regulator, penicillinase repressor